jgi:hypothetical protein
VKQFGKCDGLCKCTIARCGKARHGALAQAKYRHKDYACAGAPFDKRPPNGVSRSYTATLRQSPSDAGLFAGIRDLAHRRAFEANDKAPFPPTAFEDARQDRLAGRVGDAVQGGHTLQNDRRLNPNLTNTSRLPRRLDLYPDRLVRHSFRP